MGGARLCTLEDTLALEAMEQSLEHEWLDVMERQVATAEDSLASREAAIQGEVDKRVAGVRRALTKDYRKKLRLQESRLCKRHGELNGEADGLKKKLATAERCEKAAMDDQAEAELSFLYKQVKYVTSLVEKASDEANHVRGLQHMRSQMFKLLRGGAARP